MKSVTIAGRHWDTGAHHNATGVAAVALLRRPLSPLIRKCGYQKTKSKRSDLDIGGIVLNISP